LLFDPIAAIFSKIFDELYSMKHMMIVAFALCISAPLAFAITPIHTDPQTPDPHLTPGAWNNPPTPLDTLCASGYTTTVRNVPKSVKDKVFEEYGYDPKSINKGDYEIDHLVSLELDGTNDITNLWPESYVSQPLNAHRKDVLENTLHRLVCSKQLDLKTAQLAISQDWVAAYQKYVLHKGN